MALSGLAMSLLALALGQDLEPRVGAFEEVEVEFAGADVTLAGSLFLPAGEGLRPAVVFAHGSGPGPRSDFRAFAIALARRGIAALAYDKRGSGRSTGAWAESSLADLAGDLEAAVDFLATRPEIDSDRVGVWGFSQAGWVVAEAELEDAIASLVVVSGGGARPYEVEMHGYRSAMREAGLSPEERRRAESTLARYFDYLATGAGRSALEASIEDARGERWLEVLGLERVLVSDANRPHWSWVATFDPRPAIERMTFPVLLLFGGLDASTPTELSVARWREGLDAAGNEDVTIEVFPDAGHGITVGGHSAKGEANRFAEGYPEIVLDWIVRRASAGSAGP